MRRFVSCIDAEGRDRVVPLDRLQLLGFGIYKRLFMFHSTAVVARVDAHFESVKCAASIQNESTKEETSGEVPNTSAWKACLRNLLSDICSVKQ